MKKSVVALIVAALVVIVAVVLFASHRAAVAPSASPSSSPSSTASASVPPSVATITYSDSGFSPALTTIKSGEAVTFKNASSQDIQVDSNPHPVHTDDTDLNVGTITSGGSTVVVLNKKGTFGFHNHLNPSMTAQVTIQ